MNNKVTVVGAGFVGAAIARKIVEKDLADVVLTDIIEGLPQGKALDIAQSAPIEGFEAKIIGTNNYSETKNSDIIVIAAGLPRKPGMSRDDLQVLNAKTIKSIAENIIKYSPNTIIIMVTNPLDVMTFLAYKVSGFKSSKVIGMAGILDSTRYRYFVAEALDVPPHKVETMVLGKHGDSMVPLPRYTTVNGTVLTELLSKDIIDTINKRTKHAGSEIVNLLKNGSAFFAPSVAVTQMVECILRETDTILPCSTCLNGEYGIFDVYCGVPIKLSKDGVKEIVIMDLTDAEKEALKRSSNEIKENINKLEI